MRRPRSRRSVRHRSASLAVVIVFTFGCVGCFRTGGTVIGAGTYRDPAGWAIDVPEGWRAVPFALTGNVTKAEGAQISNVSDLPSPTAEFGMPLQANTSVVPRGGIAVIIATDEGPDQTYDRVYTPPLTVDELGEGSGMGSVLGTLWFRGNGHTFILTARISDGAYSGPYRMLASVIRSLRFD
jgi:hypothetical protein